MAFECAPEYLGNPPWALLTNLKTKYTTSQILTHIIALARKDGFIILKRTALRILRAYGRKSKQTKTLQLAEAVRDLSGFRLDMPRKQVET